MEAKTLSSRLSVGGQIRPQDIAQLKAEGFRAIIVNRPDGEAGDQPTFREVAEAARDAGLEIRYIPVESGKVSDDDVSAFANALEELPAPVFAHCRTGMRSTTMWALAQAGEQPLGEILVAAKGAGYDIGGVTRRIANGGKVPTEQGDISHDIVIVGGGAAGIATAASLLARTKGLDIAIIEPMDLHYYQPGWTLVGGGVFKPEKTRRAMSSLIPHGVKWIKGAVAAFEPENNAVILEGCRVVKYKKLVVAPGLKLNWAGIEGLQETLGKNGVTSNYRYDLAPYTWKLVQELNGGTAIFTQPPMPIKCAGAPQKAMYLSCYEWEQRGRLKTMDVEFYNAGGVLFGVADYVPALMDYVNRYGIGLNFSHNLKKIDGPNKTAWFEKTDGNGNTELIECRFDMIHVVPPQTAPDFIRVSPLAAESGWVDIDQASLRHNKYPDIYALGDVGSSPNAKTAAAARKQAPVVAENLLSDLGYTNQHEAAYDGYGSCPLTVERGKIVLAEFAYGGKRKPSFPSWFINDVKPSRAAWYLKEKILPPIYWEAMLKGREPMAKPERPKPCCAP